LQKRVLHQTPIEDAALFAPGAISPHLEEHSYPHAGQSKDGLIPIESGRPVTRVARGRGSTRKTVVNAPPYLNIKEGPGWASNQSSGFQVYVPMALFAFIDAIG